MNKIEFRIHKACVDYLEQRVWQSNKLIARGNPAFENLLFFHIPNQTNSEDAAAEGFFKKQMGVLPGAYDFIFAWHGNGIGAYDVKAPDDGALSPAQKRFRERWERCGHPSAYGTTVAHMRDTLIRWGAKCLIPNVREPDIRSDDEKKRDAFQYFAPPRKE